MFRKRSLWVLAASTLVGGGAYACGGFACETPLNPPAPGEPEVQVFWQNTPCGQPAHIKVGVLGSAQSLTTVCISAGWQVQVDLPVGADGEYTVTVDMPGAPQNLSSLVLSGPSDVPIYLHLSGVLNAGSITRADGGALYVTGTIVGNLGSLTASHLFVPQNDGILVRGDVLGPISLLDVSTPDTARGELRVQSLAPGVGGNLLGNVTVLGGALAGINASGAIGAPGSPVTIRSTLDIGSIKAKEIHANITAGWNGPASNIWRIETDGEAPSHTGNITGTIIANAIGPSLNVSNLGAGVNALVASGDLGEVSAPALLTLAGGLQPVGLNAQIVRVDGGFVPGSRISLPANGLAAQALFNLADGSANWLQGAEVVVGTRILATPLYTDTPAQLGGGSVGVARFDLHDAACEPPNGAFIDAYVPSHIIIEDPSCELLETHAVSVYEVVLRHYGPVEYAPIPFNYQGPPLSTQDPHPCEDDAVPPYLIESAPISGGPWSDVTNQFTSLPSEPAGLQSTIRVLRCDGASFRPNRIYRFTPTSALRCRSVTGAPEVANYVYTFAIGFKCDEALVGLYDLDGSSSLGLEDMLTWLTNPEDVTRDGATSGQDLSTLGEGIAEYQSLPQN